MKIKWLWTWDGKCFGYRDKDNLWTYEGKHVGKLYGTDIYNPNGKYLGELHGDRLITCLSKKNYTEFRFKPYANRPSNTKRRDYSEYKMYLGYEDFPKFEDKVE
jgi:hypothetical protein